MTDEQLQQYILQNDPFQFDENEILLEEIVSSDDELIDIMFNLIQRK